MGRWPRPRVDPAVQDDRDRVKLLHLHNSPAAKYWPTRIVVDAPKQPDGALDVRAWLRQLDEAFNP